MFRGPRAVPGQIMVTTNHGVIRRWAATRGAFPATTPGSEDGGPVGVLRLDFRRYRGVVLRRVPWADWFASFDARGLSFCYQEQCSDGTPSNYFRLQQADASLWPVSQKGFVVTAPGLSL